MNDFCAVIMTHGRAGTLQTANTLRRQGYTGPVFFIVDDEDEQLKDYRRIYGRDKVVVFSKKKAMKITDSGDNTRYKGSVVYARNVVHQLVKGLGYRYFVMLDDDYTAFRIRANKRGGFAEKQTRRLNELFEIYTEFMRKTDALCIAMSQGGDIIGGAASWFFHKGIRFRRKAMNVFFCDTERPFQFYGIMNDDVNMYINHGARGKVMFTAPNVQMQQPSTQQQEGGLTAMYLDRGTYQKSFYSVIMQPSFVKVYRMGLRYMRFHHKIQWKHAVPCILDPEYAPKRTANL